MHLCSLITYAFILITALQMHTMEQSAMVTPQQVEIKALSNFEKAYYFVRNDPVFKHRSW